MSQFSRPTFNAIAYSAARPAYSHRLYEHVLNYAFAAPVPASTPALPKTLLDLGCGPGLSTFPIAARFDRVIGIDASPTMIAAAKQVQAERRASGELDVKRREIEFLVGRSDDLKDVADGSVDIVLSAQAVHWFSMPETYRELRRVLKPGGTFVFMGYGEFFFPQSQDLSALIPIYSGQTLGEFWEQPGRSIVENLLEPIPFPNNTPTTVESAETIAQHGTWDLSRFHRHRFTRWGEPQPDPPLVAPPGETYDKVLLRHKWSPGEIEAYLNTWSAAHAYQEKHGKNPVAPLMEVIRKGMMRKSLKRKSGRIWLSWKMVMMTGRKEL